MCETRQMVSGETEGRHATPDRRSWRGFVRRYGWRAYALPILALVTIGAIVRGVPTTSSPVHVRAAAELHTAHRVATKSTTSLDGADAATADFAAGATPPPVVVNLGTDATSCAQNEYSQLVIVSIKKQHLWACQKGKQVASTPVTTGATVDNDQTPLGSWRVQDRQRDRYLIGPGYKDYVKYWVPFNGDFGFHDASWQKMKFGSPDYRRQGSHGCVHLPTPMMAWFYKWATVNNTVVTIEA
jgi:lipoprotein-anchoring transpeptidase ErfK/SrfK